MKKSRQKKLLKLLFLMVFVSMALWLFLSPPVQKHPMESVQVKVQQPSILPPVLSPAVDQAVVGDEKAQPQMPLVPKDDTHKTLLHHGPAKIAIIIDDMGLDLKGGERGIKLPSFITLSFMPYATRLREQTREARDHGHELMLHMPMEPLGHADPGPGALIVGLPDEELKQRLDTALASFIGFDGVNNHMGSKFTANVAGMELVVNELQPRHLFFLDSRTSAQTVGEHVARQHGLPTLARDIFLDDDEALSAIEQQLAQTERVAQRNGYAIAIGHPHAITLQALEAWIPQVQKRGFVLVPVHDLINLQTGTP